MTQDINIDDIVEDLDVAQGAFKGLSANRDVGQYIQGRSVVHAQSCSKAITALKSQAATIADRDRQIAELRKAQFGVKVERGGTIEVIDPIIAK